MIESAGHKKMDRIDTVCYKHFFHQEFGHITQVQSNRKHVVNALQAVMALAMTYQYASNRMNWQQLSKDAMTAMVKNAQQQTATQLMNSLQQNHNQGAAAVPAAQAAAQAQQQVAPGAAAANGAPAPGAMNLG